MTFGETELQGKTVFITGASRGIGHASALAFSKAGVKRFILHYNSHQEGIDSLTSILKAEGAEVHVLQADLALVEGTDKLVRDFGSLAIPADILINNAGALVQRAKLADVTHELYDSVMNLNTRSMYFLTQAVAPGMAERGWGRIVNLSSIAARNGGGIGAAVYAASKATVACLTKGMAKELAPQGIRVNAVSPGTVDNYFHEKYSTRQMLDNMLAQTPAGRLGDNEEVADTIVFLCSDGARYIYGQTIEINGGMYMV
jgi:3-oxoacyl-[acyl-carrier protein] reductase